MINIRIATWLDAQRIAVLWGKMYLEILTRPAMLLEYANLKNFFLKLLVRMDSPEWHVIVAEDDGEIIGFMMSLIQWPPYNPCHVIAFTEALYVEPDYRDNGLYKKLIQESMEWGKKNKVQEKEFVSPYNQVMIDFYDRMGFAPVQVVYRQKEKEA